MKIYYACSLTHAPQEFTTAVERLKNQLREQYEILDFIGVVNGTAEDVFRHDIECVKACDLLVSDCSYPAIGLGFEIATALGLNKPVLAVAHKDAKVTRLVLGINSPTFTFARYETMDEVTGLIESKLNAK